MEYFISCAIFVKRYAVLFNLSLLIDNFFNNKENKFVRMSMSVVILIQIVWSKPYELNRLESKFIFSTLYYDLEKTKNAKISSIFSFTRFETPKNTNIWLTSSELSG